jgi:hypothetical protein
MLRDVTNECSQIKQAVGKCKMRYQEEENPSRRGEAEQRVSFEREEKRKLLWNTGNHN